MTEETVREGGCGCGQVRYRLTGEPIFVNNCHCRLCQQQTGSTSVVNLFLEAGRVELLAGALTEHTVKGGSGGPHVICRCAACGTAVWSVYPRLGRLGLGVRAGTLDEPGSVTPDAVIFTDSMMPWVTLPQGIPAFPATYNPFELLPPDRVARLQAMLERRRAGEG
ncbi:GFA family protein [Alteraurantiacibacter buctensis]|uniref:GFA family protein n=1 Tax=Alteraurantiacibacter buctensis TaxID=1503981 RepID=A0A844Z2B9_9SPHN|nr:GFA family protein [Alteraurantiacibacter buctensis]MXO73300.1 GFA family protein [Alteraurantiacibacter buctensis]